MRQASLYHHFAAKDDILEAPLAGTVEASAQLAADLVAEAGPGAPRLHTLVVADTAQLCGGSWNLGTLYLLPELNVDRFAEFRAQRDRLRDHYRELSRAVIADHDGPLAAEDLPFRLVEAVINRRLTTEPVPRTIRSPPPRPRCGCWAVQAGSPRCGHRPRPDWGCRRSDRWAGQRAASLAASRRFTGSGNRSETSPPIEATSLASDDDTNEYRGLVATKTCRLRRCACSSAPSAARTRSRCRCAVP